MKKHIEICLDAHGGHMTGTRTSFLSFRSARFRESRSDKKDRRTFRALLKTTDIRCFQKPCVVDNLIEEINKRLANSYLNLI